MPGLNLIETQAVEYKYIGKSHKEIAQGLKMPKQTIDEWFKPSRGRLSPYFQVYSENMNAFRKKQVEKLMEDNDRLTLMVIRNILVRSNELLVHGRKKVLMQNGEPVLDSSGNVRYYYEPVSVKFRDVVQAWKIQRVTNGQPTDIKEKRCPSCKKRTYTFL